MWRATAASLAIASTVSSAGEIASSTRFVYEQAAEGQTIQRTWSKEVNERLPEVSALWASIAPALAEAVTAATKKPFTVPQTVHLTLTDQPSNSFSGVTVNMRYALRSFTVAPVPMRYKIDTVFHEALHEFVSRYSPTDSPLLVLHSSEPICVRNHLHLLALQKEVLLRNNDTTALEQVIAIDSQLPSGCYRRAWSLVNATPGTYRQYVAELSQ
jgi:hypothetical protein